MQTLTVHLVSGTPVTIVGKAISWDNGDLDGGLIITVSENDVLHEKLVFRSNSYEWLHFKAS